MVDTGAEHSRDFPKLNTPRWALVPRKRNVCVGVSFLATLSYIVHYRRMSTSATSDKCLKSQEQTAEPQDVLPRAFGHLTLLRQIARGGMGEVFLASSGAIEGAERPVVVKIIRRDHSDDKSFLARFLDEARIQSQLRHPGVAQVLEASKDTDGNPFVVLEHIEGRNLGEIRNRAKALKVRITWAEVAALGVALGDALGYVHKCQDASGRALEIVHRDLSPQNIMVGYGGDPKLIDFGTARGENRRCQTVAGIVFAKPGYVAPEVANNTPGGPPSDVYALGIILWELLAGRRFLSGDADEHQKAVGAGERSPSPLSQLVGGPKELDTVIARMTAPNVEDRYPTAADAATDLSRVLKQAPSMTDGQRSVRARIADLMHRLYPAEPARSRNEFMHLVASATKSPATAPVLPKSPEPPPPKPERDDTVLAGTRYRLTAQIAKSAMSTVHKAHHLDLGRVVALKLLPKHTDSDMAEQFRVEARAVAKLRHKHLVDLYDYGLTSDGRAFYAMELLEGESVHSMIERGDGVEWREACRLAIQTCKALEVAHSAGVIHRDIKPANLFVTSDGVLKLLDFGGAKNAAEAEMPSDVDAGVKLYGTPEYMAPELIKGQRADERSDVYSLGAVLYELVTGRLPHVAGTTAALLEQKIKTNPDSPRRRAPMRGIPTMVDKTISRALDSDPDSRFQNAAELRAALEEALTEPTRRQARRRGVAYAVLGALAISIGAGTAVSWKKPEVRARATAAVAPITQQINKWRGKQDAPAVAAVAQVAQPESEAPAAEPEAPLAAVEDTSEPAEPEIDLDQEPADDDLGAEPAEPTDALAAADDEPGAADEVAADSPSPDKTDFNAKPDIDLDEHVRAEPKQNDVSEKLASAQLLMDKGKRVKGFNQIRRLGKNNRKNPEVMKAWTMAASRMKGWGEAYRVAQQWVDLGATKENQMHLARMQRAVGKRADAVKTLRKLVKSQPDDSEAQAMLREYTGNTKLATRAAL